MISIAWRSGALAAAASVIAMIWSMAAPGPAKAEPTLGEVLTKLADANTLHLAIARDGNAGEAWYSQKGGLRENNPDGTYLIAKGARAWLVDEKANRASSRASALLRGEKPKLDALALLDLGESKELAAAMASRPASREDRGGAACFIYKAQFTTPRGLVKIEAAVDAATRLLRSLETRIDRDGKVSPLAKLTVLGANEPLREEMFVVGDTLTEDGRIGKVVDAQGLVSLKPVMADRWTPVGEGSLLRGGDWLQTDARGANAATLRLLRQAEAVVGPGSLVELPAADRIRIGAGEIKIVASEKAPIQLLGPGQEKVEVAGRAVYRVQNDKLVRLDTDPMWLKSFEGRAVNESIGSLVAKVDGRNEPLTVGYHKVTVDIRDQIARTVVEESFVNHTAGRLEGVFYFPLPQDASISGFGMWIGEQLVEADIVEKQRAREIYEEILRERRDPGLLEWSGGNLFKARVFPIEAHSEKRIKITYTQVLPLKGTSYRYSYALQSEMLKQHPLRELQIDVKVSSALAIANVTCLSHTARQDRTAHSAHVEFAAQEYSPSRDFEVAVEVDKQASSVVLVPHRRGDDGYFMLLLTPPAPEGQWQRDVLPPAPPQELLILADTSASMTMGQRSSQAEFIAAILASLGPKDTFNLAGCDVECDWVFDKPMPADAKNAAAARDFIERRVSLGWTDLDKAFASAMARCGPATRVIYVGDGIPCAESADPVAFAKRLKQMHQGKGGAFHAVSVGSTYERGVLQAIASLGGGSMRHIGGELPPRSAALELLGELACPPLRDLKIEFRGLRTARVYPEELPNVPAGSQQIVLGRYLPQGLDSEGEVVVTAMQGDKPVRFAARVSLKDAEHGNEFIPRLWARMHLDFLLQQGASRAIQDEIVALSEEYHIMTPYTSLLVLESDADRERFKVVRRFQMRDGEKFFAEGRDNANYELVQQQMRRAGAWRLGLRRAALGQFSTFGRDPQILQQFIRVGGGGGSGRIYDVSDLYVSDGGVSISGSRRPLLSLWNGGMEYKTAIAKSLGRDEIDYQNGSVTLNLDSEDGGFLGLLPPPSATPIGSPMGGTGDWDGDLAGGSLRSPGQPGNAYEGEKLDWLGGEDDRRLSEVRYDSLDGSTKFQLYSGDRLARDPVNGRYNLGDFRIMGRAATESQARRYGDEDRWGWSESGRSSLFDSRYGYSDWLGTLFPAVPAAAKDALAPKDRWPAEARALSDSLLRKAQLARMKDGLAVDRQTESIDLQSGEVSYRAASHWLLSPKAWLLRTGNDNQQTSVQWCDGNRRAIFQKGFLLGRSRAAVVGTTGVSPVEGAAGETPAVPTPVAPSAGETPAVPDDLKNPPLDFGPFAFTSLESSYPGYQVELKPQGRDRTMLVLTHTNSPGAETRIVVDTARHVAISIEYATDGNVTSARKFSDFVEVAGAWWAGREEWFNADGRRTSSSATKLAAVATEDFAKQFAQELADVPRVQFLTEPGRLVRDAKGADALGKADFDDQITLLTHFIRIQQWEQAFQRLSAAEKLAPGKPGMRFVRDALLLAARKNEDLKNRILAEAAELVANLKKLGELSRDDLPLAEYLLTQASNVLGHDEALALLDVIRPVYERQPAHLCALKRWTLQRVQRLQWLSRGAEATALLKQLADQYPLDCAVQVQYSLALEGAGRIEDAYAWLTRCLARPEWLPYSEEQLRARFADMLHTQGRYDDLAAFTADWMKRELPGTSAYRRHLTALIRTDHEADAAKLMTQWIKEGQLPARLSGPVSDRLNAAVSQALGQGYDTYGNQIEDEWLKPLAQVAVFFARHPANAHVAMRIMGDWRFQRTDSCRQVRKQAAEMLLADLDKLTIAEVQRLVGWIMPNDPAVERTEWKRIAAALHKRWLAATKPEDKRSLGATLALIYSSRLDVAEHLAFLREQLKAAPEGARAQYTGQLFEALTAQPWTQAHEDEAFALIERLTEANEPWARLASAVGALCTLDDRMVVARFGAKMKLIAHPEELSRTELRAKQVENLKAAREEFAARLSAEIGKRPDPLARWVDAERLYYSLLAGGDASKAAAQCWEILGPAPKKLDLEEEKGVRNLFLQQDAPESTNLPKKVPDPFFLEDVLRGRMLVTLANLACRKAAEPQLVDRLMRYIDAGIAMDKDDDRWKLMKYELLIALDRPKDLEQALAAWTRGEDPDHRWALSLGYLLAEQGKLADAVKLFEAVAAVDELGPAEYRALADWYMAVNLRDQYRRAMIATYKMTDEYQLRNHLYYRLRPWQQEGGKPPAEVDEQTLLIFAALFEKSGSPQNHLGTLRDYYVATRDFRLMACLADAVVGQTAGKVYPFLNGLGGVLGEIRDEATVDSVVERLSTVRRLAKTDVDRRALDLLEALVERRAAELKNQPGPHGDKAVAALRRAFERTWPPGEPALYADLLAGMGTIAYKPLVDEQLRELEALHRQAAKGSLDRLRIAHRVANAYWNAGRLDDAADFLAPALDEFEAASGGVLPPSANDALDSLVHYLTGRTHYDRGEKVLLEQLKHPAHQQQKLWLTLRLYSLYEQAVAAGGDTSLGSGARLYKAAEGKMLADLAGADQDFRYNLVVRLCALYTAAYHKKGIAAVPDDLRAFASKNIPELLKRQTNNYDSVVSTVAQTLRTVAGNRDALAFLIERIEQEPAWFRWNNQDGWSRHSHMLGELLAAFKDKSFRTVKGLGDLEPRLLKIVLAEERRDLRSGASRSRYIYDRRNSYWWKEKERDFARVAEEVYAERKASGAGVLHVAEYLYHGLEHYDRAIEILLIAHKDKLLEENGQWRLVEYLHWRKRYGESVAILQAMVELRSDNMPYRTALMRAYFHTKRPAELLALLEQTDEHFHKGGRWTEGAMAGLAYGCLETHLYEQSVKYYKELVPLRQRTAPNRGIGDGTLSGYYANMSRAYAGLGKTADAVDAACGAVVSWGPTHQNRADAIEALRSVVLAAPNLDGFVAELDGQAARNGQDNPLVRKAVGQAYLDRKQYDKAAAQLKLACELSPNDLETHQALIACYDQQQNGEGTIRQLLQSLQLARREIKLYEDLGKRYAAMKQPTNAERAYTSMVEVLPAESESHAALAEVRQRQDRWTEAAAQWQEVARIRVLEPTGLLKLGTAQLHLKQWDALAETIQKLRARSWPSRFGDVEAQVRNIERSLDDGRKQQQ